MSKTRAEQQVDASVGATIRLRRTSMGLSQSALAVMLGITVQQFHMYESGISRLSAGRLHAIAVCLGLSVQEIFEVGDAVAESTAQVERPSPNAVVELLSAPDVLRFNVALAQLTDGKIRRTLFDLVHALADQYGSVDPTGTSDCQANGLTGCEGTQAAVTPSRWEPATPI